MRLLKSFGYALSGLKTAFIEERNLKIHFCILFVTCVAGFYFELASMEWCIILLTAGLVIGLELINTAVENISNLITRENNEVIKKVKDIAAGAVLYASLTAIMIGIIIFAKHISVDK